MDTLRTYRKILPSVAVAKVVFARLLELNIEREKIQFLAKKGILPSDLPQASILQKTDFGHAALLGAGLGAFLGLIASLVAVALPNEYFHFPMWGIPVAMLAIALLGMWSATLVGISKPNTDVENLEADFAAGKVLLIVEVFDEDYGRVERQLNPFATAPA